MARAKKPYHWISKEIESLDPYTEYEKIFRLSASYGGNDFINNLIYTLIFPNFVVTEHGAAAVWREDGGKVLGAATARVEQTENSNATWWYYGPSDPRTQKSVEQINKLHASLAKKTPGLFSHNEDYIYTLAFSTVFMHRLRLRLGLSGVSEKVQIASHIFMGEMVKLFYSEGEVPLHGWPESWDALITFCEEYENRPWPGSEQGHLVASAIYDHFAFRCFWPSLRWLGRAIPLSLTIPTTLRAHKIEPPNPVLQYLIVLFFGWLIWIAENFLPDPETAFIAEYYQMPKAELAERKKEHRQIDGAYAAYFADRHQNQWSGCPYHASLKPRPLVAGVAGKK